MRRVPGGTTLAERLVFYSERADTGCLEWTGSDDGKAGYGKLRWQGRMRYAHQLAWEDVNGPIPAGMVLRHRCDNPPCIDIDHLLVGTQADNVADSFARGRAAKRAGEHNNSARLTVAQLAEIRRLHVAGWTGRRLAADFSMSESQISNVINHRQWKEPA